MTVMEGELSAESRLSKEVAGGILSPKSPDSLILARHAALIRCVRAKRLERIENYPVLGMVFRSSRPFLKTVRDLFRSLKF